MWITITLLAIIGIIILANYSHDKEITNRVAGEGGILKKYAVLVNEIKKDDPKPEIIKVTNLSISLRASNIDGYTEFAIKQDADTVRVEWKVGSRLFGSHKQRWEFPERLDQLNMISKIRSDLTITHQKIASKITGINFADISANEGNSENESSPHDERERSLAMIASKLNCSPQEAKEKYFMQMDNLNPTETNLSEVKKNLLIKSQSESTLYNIGELNTPSAIYYQWTLEYSKQKKETADDNLHLNLKNKNSKLLQELIFAHQSNNLNDVEKILRENPEYLDFFLEEIEKSEDDDLPF